MDKIINEFLINEFFLAAGKLPVGSMVEISFPAGSWTEDGAEGSFTIHVNEAEDGRVSCSGELS